MEEMRLQKYLANAGVCSRRKAEELILQGKIRVNDKVEKELGKKVIPNQDVILYENKRVVLNEKRVYILLNKPIGYVTTVKEQFGRPAIIELVENVGTTILPVGRLDMYTSGAIILTNDGDFIYRITHPKNEIEKTYTATVSGIVTNSDVEKLKKGVIIDDYISGKAKVKILKIDTEKKISRIEITIHEGKNREVRKMCAAIGKNVRALHRSKIGSINIKDLEIGQWRYLTQQEIDSFKN